MNIELKEITIRELIEGYQDNNESGVVAYGGKLEVRPPYQREFVYNEKQRDAVINTVNKKFPLNVMYWAVREDGTYEVIDGQQRTISICRYGNGDFAFMFKYVHNLREDEKDAFLNYKLMVYLCSGSESEKLDWFRTINIAGEKLTEQELKNAVYCGTWVSDAKRYFSKNGCPAYNIGSDYVNGSPIRQEYLERAIDWISEGNIEVYMSKHQHDPNASALWRYFQDVITWVDQTFVVKRKKYMKGVEWGRLYNVYKDKVFDTASLEEETKRLILDDDVTKKSGIYEYLLTGKDKHLSIRSFSDITKQKVFELQNGKCIVCKETFAIEYMEADHITPWHEGGQTLEHNCQMLCKECNRRKSGI
jgi:hypothetical protein